jgi:hypothetical protein
MGVFRLQLVDAVVVLGEFFQQRVVFNGHVSLGII